MLIEGKIWGKTCDLFNKNNVKISRVVIDGGYQCSKHSHLHTHNMFFVESGQILLRRWKNEYDLVDDTSMIAGDSCSVPPGEYHRFIGCDDKSVVYEIYWTELSDDIQREDCGGEA